MVIFLDIDGVLSTYEQIYCSNKKKWHPKYNCYKFDMKCVKVFNEILQSSNDIQIVLSINWKNHYSIREINEIFKWNNVKCKINDITPTLWGTIYTNYDDLEKCRASEILKYVKTNNIKKYIAIDDLDLSNWLDDNFIHTPRIFEGIKQTNIKNKILKKIENE